MSASYFIQSYKEGSRNRIHHGSGIGVYTDLGKWPNLAVSVRSSYLRMKYVGYIYRQAVSCGYNTICHVYGVPVDFKTHSSSLSNEIGIKLKTNSKKDDFYLVIGSGHHVFLGERVKKPGSLSETEKTIVYGNDYKKPTFYALARIGMQAKYIHFEFQYSEKFKNNSSEQGLFEPYSERVKFAFGVSIAELYKNKVGTNDEELQ